MSQQEWLRRNAQHLDEALGRVRAAAAGQAIPDSVPGEPATALNRLCETFRLDGFERDVLVLAAGPSLDSTFGAGHATVGLALACLPGARWSAFAPAAALRRWRLVELIEPAADAPLSAFSLRIDERVLFYLLGTQYLDQHLRGIVRPLPLDPANALTPSHAAIAERVSAALRSIAPPVIAIQGAFPEMLCAIAARACADAGYTLFRASGADLPATTAERETAACLWEREAALTGAALLIETDDGGIARFLDSCEAPVLIASREPLSLSTTRPVMRIGVSLPAPQEELALWRTALGARAAEAEAFLPALASQFRLSPGAIAAAAAEAMEGAPEWFEARLWEGSREQARTGMEGLAVRIESRAGWNDLVLPEPQLEILHDISAHVRRKHRVYDDWGFAGASSRGLGTSVVFAGPSGTGKTLAAEVLANSLRLDLYRIDLSLVVSKYIGETEKNLRRIFAAAERGGAILLFDEADALFGKRSEVKDSHDRYANLEVSYLLQQMEAYRGVAILTTNMLTAFDPAFLRRLRFVVQFPFPSAEQRCEIWSRVFPAQTPTGNLDLRKLARLNLTGGNIRNIALNAAFLAANSEEAVSMKHLLRAARSEYNKLEKPLSEAEIGDWLHEQTRPM